MVGAKLSESLISDPESRIPLKGLLVELHTIFLALDAQLSLT